MTVRLNESLTLASGLTLPNRLVKAAMTEGLADGNNIADDLHATLYRRWARSGIGLQITGNVLVDRRFLEQPGNVAIEFDPSNEALDGLAAMAEAAQSAGGRVIMQVSHAGRQTPALVNERPIAPSSVELKMMGQKLNPFGRPRAMTGEEVEDAIARFVNAIEIAHRTGYDGVQVHAAHGYLISQFLSPRSNQRDDEWGGTLENRSRFLREVIHRAKAAVPETFSISVKLNSSDFQKGGFSHEDCLQVVDWLNELEVDFVEISGGNYEQPQMMGLDGLDGPEDAERLRSSTRAREAYFVDYAKSVRARARMPVLATGGFRNASSMETALSEGFADLIGLARPLCGEPDLPAKLLDGTADEAADFEAGLRLGPTRWLGINSPIGIVKTLNGWGQQGWYRAQVSELAHGREPNLKLGVLSSLSRMQSAQKSAAKAYKAARASETG